MSKIMSGKLLAGIAACLLVGGVIVAGGAMPPATAQATISVSIDPETQTVGPGESSSMDVVVDSSTYNLKACHVEVSYDSALFSDVSVVENGLLGTEILVEPGSGVSDGAVTYGVTRLTGNEPVPVSGSFITISFTVSDRATGSYNLDLHDSALKDETNATIPGVVENGGTIDTVEPKSSGNLPKAAFATSNFSVSPSEVNIGEEVTISLTVTNTGNAAGSYEVSLNIDGAVEATKEVTLNAGASEKVTFTTAKDAAGSYSVAVDGLSGSFSVREGPAPLPPPAEEALPEEAPPAEVINWPVIGGVIAGVVIVGLLIFFLVGRRAV